MPVQGLGRGLYDIALPEEDLVRHGFACDSTPWDPRGQFRRSRHPCGRRSPSAYLVLEPRVVPDIGVNGLIGRAQWLDHLAEDPLLAMIRVNPGRTDHVPAVRIGDVCQTTHGLAS